LISLWTQYHNGFGLPLSGGWMEQPVLWMDFISLIEIEYNKWRQLENG